MSRTSRALYRPKRARSFRRSRSKGLRLAGWTRRSSSGSPSTGRRRRSAGGCSSTASLVAPGSFFGPAGEGYVRMALVPTQAECDRAAEILEERAVTTRRDDRGARPRRDSRRRAGRRRLERQRRRCRRRSSTTSAPPDGAARGRAVRVPRQDPAQVRLRGARRSRRAPCRRRGLARSCRGAWC